MDTPRRRESASRSAVQSLDDDSLKLIAPAAPTPAGPSPQVDAARLSAVRSLGIDLILGLPGQQRTRVIDDIRTHP